MGVIWCLFRLSTCATILFLVGATTLTKSQDIEQSNSSCYTCIKVNTTCYQLEFLFNLSGNFRNNVVIRNLGVLRRDNHLFYSYEPDISDPEYVKVGFVSLQNGSEAGVLSSQTQLFNFGAFDIDQEGGVMYLGGSLGVYQLDTNIHKLTPFSSRFDTIVALFYKNGIYFVQEAVGKIVYKQGDYFIPLIETDTAVSKFVITKDGFVVYVCTAGLMASKNNDHVVLSTNPFFRGLTIDLDGNVHAWWVDGIYKVILANVLKESTVVKIAHIPSIGSMTFDNANNILFTAENALYKLSVTNFMQC